jgi:N-acetylmuramoyl-L-alanine amidase
MKFGFALAIFIPLLVAQTRQPTACSVTAIHHSSTSDVTRLTIDLSSEFVFRSGRLEKPERIYFDILNSSSALGFEHVYSEKLNDQFVQQIRVSDMTESVTRILLTLTRQAVVVSSESTNPSRLIIELRKTIGGTTLSQIPFHGQHPPVYVNQDSRGSLSGTVPSLALAPGTTSRNSDSDGVGEAASRGDSSLTRALGLKIRRVVIDPGHGGPDAGTSGVKGLREKDLVLDLALQLGAFVKARKGWDVVYTRTADTYVSLEARTALANERKADLFLSIHANSSPRAQSTGVETYYLNITANREDLAVAARENASSQKSVSELPDILTRIGRYDKAAESSEFARYVQRALAESCKGSTPEGDRGVKTAPFVVLIGADMPAVLAEVGFLSNPKEELMLSRPSYRQKVVEALYEGMNRYAQSLSHFQDAGKP